MKTSFGYISLFASLTTLLGGVQAAGLRGLYEDAILPSDAPTNALGLELDIDQDVESSKERYVALTGINTRSGYKLSVVSRDCVKNVSVRNVPRSPEPGAVVTGSATFQTEGGVFTRCGWADSILVLQAEATDGDKWCIMYKKPAGSEAYMYRHQIKNGEHCGSEWTQIGCSTRFSNDKWCKLYQG